MKPRLKGADYIISVKCDESRLMSEIRYSKEAQALWVLFRESEIWYRYDEVPRLLFETLVREKSRGVAFNRMIRDDFIGVQDEPPGEVE